MLLAPFVRGLRQLLRILLEADSLERGCFRSPSIVNRDMLCRSDVRLAYFNSEGPLGLECSSEKVGP